MAIQHQQDEQVMDDCAKLYHQHQLRTNLPIWAYSLNNITNLVTQQTVCNLYTLVGETTKLVVLYFNYVSEHYKVNY